MDINNFLNSGIIERYVLGLADRDDMDLVDKMAKDYPQVNAHICKMQNCMEEYAEMNAVIPPKHEKKTILVSLNEEREIAEADFPEQEASFKIPEIWKWGIGLAATMLVALGALCSTLYKNQKEAQNQLSVLSTQMNNLQSDQKVLETRKESIYRKFSTLKDVNTRQVHLKGSNHAPETLVVVYWNPQNEEGYLNADNLPKCPNGHDYQVWADVNGKHMDMGLLKPNAQKDSLYTVPYFKNCKGFVITLEKQGGSTQPSSETTYAFGNIAQR